MKRLFLVATVSLLFAIPALATEATFDRTLSVKGQATLMISTGSGHIYLTRGTEGQVAIHARVKNGWGGSESQVQEIVNHPPIEQTGDIIRVGVHPEHWNRITIDYDVQLPANTLLKAETGSGDIHVEGAGQDATLETGSGEIRANGLNGRLKVETGSGNIEAEINGTGIVKAETGSGSITLRGVQGALSAETGSGDIHVAGTPGQAWKLETGSGSIDVEVGHASFDLDAETGSGSVHVEQPFTPAYVQKKDHIASRINGGGPMVKAESGSGNIHVR